MIRINKVTSNVLHLLSEAWLSARKVGMGDGIGNERVEEWKREKP